MSKTLTSLAVVAIKLDYSDSTIILLALCGIVWGQFWDWYVCQLMIWTACADLCQGLLVNRAGPSTLVESTL